MPNQKNFTEIIERLVTTSFVRVKSDFTLETVDTKWLGFLLFESIREYGVSPEVFGNKPNSFNKVMKPLFAQISKDSNRMQNLRKLAEAYERGPRSRELTRVRDKIAGKGELSFSSCVQSMRSNNLIPEAVSLNANPSIHSRQCRRLNATLTRAHCIDPSENEGDELYLITGATLFDQTGIWMKESECSHNTGKIYSDNNIDFSPGSIKTLFEWDVENPNDEATLWPVTGLCTITLMEKDSSDKNRVYQAFQAAYSTGQLLIAIAAGSAGPVGVAIAIVSILTSLLMALDADDNLGAISLRFDNVLEGVSTAQYLPFTIKGTDKGNYYEYSFGVSYSENDYRCPFKVPFSITGPEERTIPGIGRFTEGKYKIKCPSPLHEIVWSVSPSASINEQGKRSAKIIWDREGSYIVSVTAKEQSGIRTHSTEMRVNVNMGSGPPPQ